MIQFPHSAARAVESATAGLLSRAGAGMSITEAVRELAVQSSPAKRLIASPFKRDLTAAGATGGGYLIGAGNLPPETFLDRFSVIRQSGARVVTGLTGPVTVPRTATLPTAAWIAEGGTATESQPTLGQLAATPHFCSVYTEASRALLLQAAAEAFIEDNARESIARALDAAALNGSGASGEPRGLLGASGVGSVSGTSFDRADAEAMVKACLDAGAAESRLRFIGAPDVRELLGKRESFTGAGALWQDGKLAGIPAAATASMPAGSLVCGDWSRLTVYVFDGAGGIELLVNPFANFQAGIVALALTVPVDFSVSPAAAFCKSTSIT